MKSLLLSLVFILMYSNSIAQCESISISTATNFGPYTVETLTEWDGIRNGPDYYGATIYYPINATPPFASIVIVPGFLAAESSIQNWGPFFASHGITTMTIGTNSGFDQPETRAEALVDALETVRQENARLNSPLYGALNLNRLAVSGWSMGGGGAQLAVSLDPTLKAVIALCPWLDTSTLSQSTLNHSIPTLFLSGEYDGVASPSIHANIHYDYTPISTPKLLYEVENGDHFVANGPEGGNGEVGRMALSWLKKYLLDEDCYCPLLLDVPLTASNYQTNVDCETSTAGASSQHIEFNDGWSIISTHIIPENTDFASIVSPIVESMIIAKDYSGAAYLPEWGFNGIGDLQQGQGFLVKMSTDEVLVINGTLIQAEGNPIYLIEGWNMIAYYPTLAISADLIFAELTNDNNLIIVKDCIGNAFLPEWDFNGIGDLEPGKGYQLKVNTSSVLQY
jgi:pimeloyl-ACP methyl ester carboxylesterase